MSDQQNQSSENLDTFDEHEEPVRVRVKNPATGQTETFEVREFPDDGLGKWMQKVTPRAQKDDYVGMHEELIVMCLFDESGNAVSPGRIAKFGPRLKQHLFRLCQQMNGLTDEAVKRAGKDFAATGAGSSGGGSESPAS